MEAVEVPRCSASRSAIVRGLRTHTLNVSRPTVNVARTPPRSGPASGAAGPPHAAIAIATAVSRTFHHRRIPSLPPRPAALYYKDWPPAPPVSFVPIYSPQLARLVKHAPEGDDWLHEMKYDGYRIGCAIGDGTVTLLSRNGSEWTAAFPEIAKAALQLGVTGTLLDGEVAIVLPDGRTSFQALQNSFDGGPRRGLVYFVFDVL